MKKAILILLCCVLLGGVASCNQSNEIDSNGGEQIIPTTNSNATETEAMNDEGKRESLSHLQEQENSNKEKSKVVEQYKATLNNFMNGIIHEMVYWPNLSSNSLLSFAIVDMNGDDFPEVIVENSDEYAVLYYVDGEENIYACDFGFRSMYHLMKDGTFSWNNTSSSGHEYGVRKLMMYGGYCRIIDLWTIRNDGTDDAEYFIFGQYTTAEELDAFCAQLSDVRADFYELNSENIEKYITDDSFILK